MNQIAVFPKAPINKNEAPEPPKEIDVSIGDKVRVRIRDKKKPATKSDDYVEAGPPERTGEVVFVSDRWVTVDVGPYRICVWKSDIAVVYRDGRPIVAQPDAESWGKKGRVAR
ncbi:MAG TPA: hypothetical protein GX517_04495 [Alicyclobacillus sp.]|nr:hypothetical protein [Alicyclobacillus sp.]